MISSKTKDWYLEAVRMNVKADPELRDKLLNGNHERVDIFLQNLEIEMNKAQARVFRKRGRPIEEKTLKGIVYDFTLNFMANMELEAKRRYESDLARLAREAKAQEFKDMESTLEGKPSGIFEEAGVIVDEETRKDQVLPDKGRIIAP